MKYIFILLIFFIPVSSFFQQTVSVKGKLTCGNSDLSNTKVKLWDKNTIGSDTLLNETTTDMYGQYSLYGGSSSLFKMNVLLKIYHDCNDSFKPCQRKNSFRIPDQYIFRSSIPSTIFNAGTLNMSLKYPDEERSCIN